MIEGWVLGFSLVLARTATFVGMLPIFGGRYVPRLAKIGLAVALALVWAGSPPTAVSDPLARVAPAAQWLPFGLAVGREMVLGAMLGQALALFILPARVAGEFIGQEMGLAMGHLSDPGVDSSATVMGEVFEMLGVLIFFGMDGHHVMLATLHAAFLRWPVGGPLGPVPLGAFVATLGTAQQWGLLLAAPVGACLFLTTVVLALMARAAPQLNILSVGFSLKLGIGLAASLVLIPEIAPAMAAALGHFSEFVRGW